MKSINAAMSLIAFSRDLAERELDGEISRGTAIGRLYQAATEASNHGVDWRWALEFYKQALDDARDARSCEALLKAAMEEPDAQG